MYDLDQIAAGIVTNLQPLLIANGGILGQIQPVAVNPTPPCAFVVDGKIEYDEALGRGLDCIYLQVIVQVGLTTERGAQQKLRALRASGQVKQLVEADQTLGGSCDVCRVTEVGEPELYGRQDGTAALGCSFTVEVFASGA